MQSLSAILKDVNDKKTSEEKIETLRTYIQKDNRIGVFLHYACENDPKTGKPYVWDVDVNKLDYRPSKRPDLDQALLGEIRRLYIFIEGGYPGLLRERKNTLAIQLLESIDPEDAMLLTTLWRTGKLRFRGISSSIVTKAIGADEENG